jgi:hypothetical protein
VDGGPLKPGFSLSGEQHFWQKRYYDFNIRDHSQFVEKLRYIRRNPVKAELCERPEDWEWSSFRHYAIGCEGRVEIESEWTARKRERAAGDFVQPSNCADLLNSVIPTGADHREGDDLRSGGTLCFLWGRTRRDRLGIDDTKTARAAGRFFPTVELPHSSQNRA